MHAQNSQRAASKRSRCPQHAGGYSRLGTYHLASVAPLSSIRASAHARADTYRATSSTWHNGTSHVTHYIERQQAKHMTDTSPARSWDIPHSRYNIAVLKTRCTQALHAPITPHSSDLCAPHTALNLRQTHPAASTPHSLKSCQAAQRRWNAVGELVEAQVQLPAEHADIALHNDT
jgi:hypothetical protein